MSNPTTTPAGEAITIYAGCSDDEDDYTRLGFTFGPTSWSPQPAEVAELYESISKTSNKLLEFSWKSPGRRNPEEEGKLAAKKKESLMRAPKAAEPKATDFDFEEDSAPSLVRKKAVPVKRTTKKKAATSLTGILASMERHRIMDQQASAESTDPSAPGSSANNSSTS